MGVNLTRLPQEQEEAVERPASQTEEKQTISLVVDENTHTFVSSYSWTEPVWATRLHSGRALWRAMAAGQYSQESRDWPAGRVTARHCCLRPERRSLLRLPLENL